MRALLKNMKIGTRLQLMAGLSLILMLTMGLAALIGMSSINADVKLLVTNKGPKTEVLDEIYTKISMASSDLNVMLLTGDPAVRQEALSRITEDQRSITQLLEKMTSLVKSLLGRELLAKIEATRAAYLEQQHDAIELIRTGAREQAAALILGKLEQARFAYATAVTTMVRHQDSDVRALGTHASNTFDVVMVLFPAIVLGAAILLGVGSSIITLSITQPIAACVAAATKLAAGDTTVILDSTARDETGVLQGAMAKMVAALQALINDAGILSQAAAAGKLATRANPAHHQGDFRKIVVGVNETLDAVIGPLNVAAEYVDRIAKGDIPPRITDPYQGDFKEIKNNLNVCIDIMNNLLSETLRVIQATAAGNLDERAKAELFSGDWHKLVTGVNEIVTAIVIPLELSTRQLHEEATERRKAQELLLIQQLELEAQNTELETRVADEVRQNRGKDLALMQSAKMAAIGQLAAGVCHEINNPMAYISSNLHVLGQYVDQIARYNQIRQDNCGAEAPQLMRETSAPGGETQEIAQIMADGVNLINESRAGAARITKIVRDLKSFSRVDMPEREPAALNYCLENALTICYNELKSVAIIRKEYESMPEILCQPGQLNQVFLHLLVNAGQAIDQPGEILLRCWHDDAFVYASVGDTGSGMSEEIKDRIFDPFYTTRDVGKGAGLGLSISSEIIKQHRGELLVASVVGKGTTFTIKLPRSAEIV